MRVLFLYRPRLPSTRAQAIQTIHAAHALAERGHHVTVLADRGAPGTATEALAGMGLSGLPTLDLRVAPTSWKPAAGLWYRARVAAWSGDVALARAERPGAVALARAPLVVEAHEVTSLLLEERGEASAAAIAAEAALYARARGVIANAAGTMEALEAVCALPGARAVIPNATRADRSVAWRPDPTPTVVWAGSPHHEKGLATVLRSVERWPDGVELLLLGGAPEGALPARVRVAAPVPPAEVSPFLARARVLLLSLADDAFGRRFASPLKLWDYLAVGAPIVAPDLPSVRPLAPEAHFFRPGDPADLARAIREALAAPPRAPRLRTWAERATEVERLLLDALAGARS